MLNSEQVPIIHKTLSKLKSNFVIVLKSILNVKKK